MLVTDVNEARGLYREAGRCGFSIPALCAENTQTIEAILRAADESGREYGIGNVPIVIAFTAHYHARQQLSLYTALGDIEEGFLAIKDDILRLTRKGGPYDSLKVMVHLDHAHPEHDRSIIERGVGFFSSVMYDASHLPLAENARLTAAFTREFKGRFVIEGAVDEIFESGETVEDGLTKAEDAERYVKETGVDLIVCNLGTEHRASAADRKYRGDRAREISGRVGKMLVLHGTSSLNSGEMKTLADDGVIKVNIWTRLEETGGRAVARDIVDHADQLLSERPPLALFTESHRRYDVWMPAVVKLLKDYLRILGYERMK
jgi:fructose-bisphosphate aldolase class II